MKRGSILFALAVTLPGAALAVAPAAKAPAKPAVVAAPPPKSALPLQPGTHRASLSPEGNAIAQRIFSTPDPRAAQFQAEFTAIKQEQQKLLVTQPVDMDKLTALVQRAETLQSQVAKAKDDKLLELLRALPEADRGALLQQIFNPAQPQNSRPATPAKPAPTPGH
jgi:hypothetical protein